MIDRYRLMALTRITSKVMRQYRDLHLKVDFKRKFVELDSRTLVFTRKEYELFSLLVENAGEFPRRLGARAEARSHWWAPAGDNQSAEGSGSPGRRQIVTRDRNSNEPEPDLGS